MTPAKEAVERLTAIYGDPKTDSPELFLAEYEKALTGIENLILHRAIDRIVKQSTFWPKPAEIIVAVNAVAYDFARYKPAEHRPIEKRGEPTLEQKARVAALLDEAKRALSRPDRTDDAAVPDWTRGQATAFEKMQRTSPGRLHLGPSLTPTSKRITGERDDA